MPGLLGILTEDTKTVRQRLAAAQERLGRHGRTATEILSSLDDRLWLAHTRLEHAPRTVVDGGSRPSAAFHGVLFNDAELRRRLPAAPVEAVGALIAALYESEGVDSLARLDGEFSLAVLDPARRAIIVATDPLGNYPLYWYARGREFVVSSDLSALLRAVPHVNRLNLEAVADYLTIGAVLEQKTLVEDVHLLEPGTVLEFRLDDGAVRLHQYLDLQSLFSREESSRARYLDRVQDAFTQSVSRALTDTRPVGLSLSGGLDSRTVLAAVNGHASGLRTYTLGVAGCADQAVAKRLAQIAGTHHQFFEIDPDYLRDFLPNMAGMVSATDGLYLSHGLTEMLAIRSLGDTGIRVLLRGHGGELAKTHLAWPLQTDNDVRGSRTVDECLPHLAARANYITPDLSLDQVLLPAAAKAAGRGAFDAFRRLLEGTRLSPMEACSYLYLRELHRRFTVPSLELFRTRVEVRLPFMDVGFLRVLLSGPAEWRDSTEIHRRIIERGQPKFLEVRNANTGAPVDAGAATERILDKVNHALRLLNVRGYRHYHNFDEWMRLSLIRSVEAELAGDFVRTRGIVSAATIRRLIDDTARGTRDRSYLLQVLLILELWMRENHVEAAA
jgi:asparagine synthase (glutamine-hydrolysing)